MGQLCNVRVISTLNGLSKQRLVEGSLEVEDFTSLQSVLSLIEPGHWESLERYQLKMAAAQTRGPMAEAAGSAAVKYFCLPSWWNVKIIIKVLRCQFPYLHIYAWILALSTRLSLRKHSQDHLFENYRCNTAVGFSPSLRDSALNILQLLVFFGIWPLGSLFFFFLSFLCCFSASEGIRDGLWLLWGDRKNDICAFPQHFAPYLYSNNSLRLVF